MELIYGIVFIYMIAIAIRFLKAICEALGEVIEYVWDLYERFNEKHNVSQSMPDLKIDQSRTEPKIVYKGWRNDDIINKVLNDIIPPTENQK